MERIFGELVELNSNKAFGFIRPEDDDEGEDIFFHITGVRGANKDFRSLRLGQRVSFLSTRTAKGLRAEDVALAS